MPKKEWFFDQSEIQSSFCSEIVQKNYCKNTQNYVEFFRSVCTL